GPEASRVPHQSVSPAPHQNHPTVVGDVPGNPYSRYPAHDYGAPAVSWSVSENTKSAQSAGGTAGSRKESESVP
ncbi:hypothetical protein A2U01_0072970, partial [Trifolium medium]|nr:hypothetical protein [Trifolium medium]